MFFPSRFFAARRNRSSTFQSSRRSYKPSLEVLEDRHLLATLTVFTTADSGQGSLRQAILDANALPGLDMIQFSLEVPPFTISPLSPLPAVTDPVIIDGTTQPGFTGAPIIELDGSNAGPADGLAITAGGSTVRGLIIDGFQGNGISLLFNGGNDIEGDYLGTNGKSPAGLGNTGDGIFISNASNNTIGGTGQGTGNVISGNGGSGVAIVASTTSPGLLRPPGDGTAIGPAASQASGNLIQGNFIGTNLTGTVALGNASDGVTIDSAPGNILGGSVTGAGNVISANGGDGVRISGTNAAGNLLQGNLIGTDASGTRALGNAVDGIGIADSSNNTIGGSAGNTIAFNGGNGVTVVSGTGNGILSNSIFANNGLGIDLGGEGVTLNDPNDLDTGANNLQNFPVIVSVTPLAESVQIKALLNSSPSTTFVIQFFGNAAADPSGFGQGKTFIGSTVVTTDANGNAVFTANVAPGLANFITATATDPADNTSEFSGLNFLSAAGLTACAVESRSANVALATFTDASGPEPAANYSATIDWNDGTPASAGVVTLSGTTFTVSGSHAFGTEGTLSPRVTITDIGGRTTSVTATVTVEGFVTSLYHVVLGREPDTAGLHAWLQALQAGATRAQVAEGFWISAEHRGLEVDQFYQTFLHRPADAAGRAGWVNALLNGVTEANVVIAFVTSPEYTRLHPDASSYVTGLYEDILGRAPDAAGQSFWERILSTGQRSRAAVAYYFLSSSESLFQAVHDYYVDFLGREPSLAEEQGYVNAMASGQLTPATVTALFLGSQEYLDRQLDILCQGMG